MKNYARIFFAVAFILVGLLSAPGVKVRAQESSGELIRSYSSEILVNIDNSIDVVENILYDGGTFPRHGIYRDIVPYSAEGRLMSIQDVSVVDENDIPQPFEVLDLGNKIRIKIGDPGVTFEGQRIYIIKYHATKAVSHLEKLDEIYWNITGTDWGFPILKVSAYVRLPSGASMTQSSCYFGIKGSTTTCNPAISESGVYKFDLPFTLSSGEGLTVAVGFPKNIVSPYSVSDFLRIVVDYYLPWFFVFFWPIFTLGLSLFFWYKTGRDPKMTGVIVPQYDVPDGLTPMEVSGIVNGKINTKDISPEIIYLATKGYIQIRQLDTKVLGLFSSTDYELVKMKEFFDLANEFDRKLLEALFRYQNQAVKLSELKNIFYTHVSGITKLAYSSLIQKNYYKTFSGRENGRNKIELILLLSFAVPLLAGWLLKSKFNLIPVSLSIFLSLLIYLLVSYFFPAKTEKGVATTEYILGLKDYLRIAEKDRLEFHNSPEKKPEVFEKLLPYAMVLGVADIWAKEFDGIYNTPPSWYQGAQGNVFNAVAFNKSLSSFSAFAFTSLSSKPSSNGGGSGGGGFSGGGGGGGGGGSW